MLEENTCLFRRGRLGASGANFSDKNKTSPFPINPTNDTKKNVGEHVHLPKIYHMRNILSRLSEWNPRDLFFWGSGAPEGHGFCQASEVATRHIHIWSLIDMPLGGSQHLYPEQNLDFGGSWVGGKKHLLPKWWCKMVMFIGILHP